MAINIKFFLALLAVLDIYSTGIPAAKADGEVKETEISVYFHDFFGGPSPTDLAVVGIAGDNWTYTQFGTLFVLDDLVTEGPERTSPAVGRLQGTYITSSLDGQNVGLFSSLVFTDGLYKGSTLQIIGNVNQFAPISEYGVASGTGEFRYAKGYAIFETISFDRPNLYTVLRINASFYHH